MNVHLPRFTAEQLFKTLSQAEDWGISQTKVENVWSKSKGNGIKIAVLDTGCPGTKNEKGEIKIHPDLKNNILVDECKTFVPTEDIFDQQGHSTAVCGTIAAEDNTVGFVGYAPEAKIVTYKVLDKSGGGSLRWIERALEECVKTKPDIVSMSLGCIEGSPRLHDLVKKLDEMGIPVICAAGNGGEEEGINYPAKYQESFAIGAYDSDMNIAGFSAIGQEIDFAFPGVDIHTTWLNNSYIIISGTSFACPACTGVVALILSVTRSLNSSAGAKNTMWIYDILKNMATNPKKIKNKTSDWGWGYIDMSLLRNDTAYISLRNQAIKQKLKGTYIFDEFTNEEAEKIFQTLEEYDLEASIDEMMKGLANEYPTAILIHKMMLAKSESRTHIVTANHTLKTNLEKLSRKGIFFLNPVYWIKRYKFSKIQEILDLALCYLNMSNPKNSQGST